MKRLTAIVLLLALLCGCAPAAPVEQPTQPSAVPTEPAETTRPTVPVADPTAAHLKDILPTMDGSTSLIPLEAAIRAAIYGKTMEEATADVVHSTTWQSFYNLLVGTTQLIFSCPLSRQQYEEAAYQQVQLEQVPVAMEGFVFVVNADNPVDTLSQQQLKDIYSGRITNWSEVGGPDLPIIAYQRNADSGSQNFMLDFMGDTPLMDAPLDRKPASMSGLMDVIAINDNSLGAIGYSVYAYAANMYGNGNEIKFIKVDGVEPSRKTFADRSYPLLGKNYAVFRADEPEDSPVRQLVAWLTSYDGQLAVAKAGYVTVMDVGFDYEEMTLKTYRGIGTGAPAREAQPDVYRAVQTGEWGVISRQLPLRVDTVDGMKTYRLEVEADEALLSQVHSFIDAQMRWAKPEGERVKALLQKLNDGWSEYPLYSYGPGWDDGAGYWEEGMDASCMASASNGYLSVAVCVCFSYNVMDTLTYYGRTETATWDLLTGKQLTPEELFCRDVDINAALSPYLRKVSQEPRNGWGNYYELKRDLASLPADGWHLTHDAIYFDSDNPYFQYGCCISLEQLSDGLMVSQTPRAFSATLGGEKVDFTRGFRILTRDTVYERFDEDTALALLDQPRARQMNDFIRDYATRHYTYQAVTDYFVQKGQFQPGEQSLWFAPFDWYLINFGDRYVAYCGTDQFAYDPNTGYALGRYPYETCFLFDLKTGRQISWQELLLPGWQEHAQVSVTGEESEGLPWDELILLRVDSELAGGLSMGFYLEPEGSEPGTADVAYVSIHIPAEYVKFN